MPTNVEISGENLITSPSARDSNLSRVFSNGAPQVKPASSGLGNDMNPRAGATPYHAVRRSFRTSHSCRTVCRAAIWVVFCSFPAGMYAQNIPTGYEAASDAVVARLEKGKDQPHDSIVADAVEHYRVNKKCKVYVAKPPKNNESPSTCDLIVVCDSEQCKDGWVVFIEVKGGEPGTTGNEVGGFDKAVKQLDEGARAALDKDKGVIKKPNKDTPLDKCYRSTILVPKGKTLKDASKLAPYQSGEHNPNWTKIGDDWVQPKVEDNVAKLPPP